MAKPSNSGTLLSAVTSTGSGAAVAVDSFRNFAWVVKAASVTSGGTMAIEARFNPGGDWVVIDSRAISANGDVIVQAIALQIYEMRANLTARTDGTFTVTYSAAA